MRFAVFLFAVLLLAASPLQAWGAEREKCTCTANVFSTRWAASDAVFAGTVEEINVINKRVQYGNDDLPVEVKIKIEEPFKAAKQGETFVLLTSLTRDTCTGHPFEKGKKYLIFAYQRKDSTRELWSLYTFSSRTWDVGGLCGGTKLYDDDAAKEDLKRIDKILKAPKKKGFMENLFNP